MILKEKLESPPKGWKKIKGAITAPNGYEWWSNGKSRFGGEYQCALVKKQEDTTNEP